MLDAWSSARYVIPLPEGHRFPMVKYERVREVALASGAVAPERMHDAPRADDALLRLVHTAAYVEKIRDGGLDAAEQRRLGFPWSPQLAERSYRVVGGTLATARHALEHGVAINLAGGTHHAFPDRGEGFCVFNDVAIAVRALRGEGIARRVAIVDLDVHQGNGTHAIFANDSLTYTFSMHGRNNYPFHKVPGSLDIELEDGTGDLAYLALLAAALPRVLAEARPELVIYLAGADPHEGDRLGRLTLTHAGLARRDRVVLELCRDVGIPVALTIAGGYGRNIETTVQAHAGTLQVLLDFAG